MKQVYTVQEYKRLINKGHSQPVRGVMNKTEKEHALSLNVHQAVGRVQDYLFDKITFKLAPRTTYTPDFFVLTEDGIEIHEVKGSYVREDSLVKLKVAASMFPQFKWFLYQKRKEGWRVKQF